MSLQFTSIDGVGDHFEWKLERGGNLFARAAGKQRWRQIAKNVFNIEDAKAFVLEYQGHKEVN
jgi:hypothetical protein